MKSSTGHNVPSRRDEYTTAEEFCSIFNRSVDRHYLLALLLTCSESKALECVVLALEDCQKAQVFKPWADSWARLSVIDRAMKIMGIGSHDSLEVDPYKQPLDRIPSELASVMKLRTFQRFVYVLTVLEKYSIRDVAILMKRSKREVMEVQQEALVSVSGSEVPTGSTPPHTHPLPLSA